MAGRPYAPTALRWSAYSVRSFCVNNCSRAPLLAKASDPNTRKISIKADLTKRQRDMEADLHKRARDLNIALSQDEVTKNGVWKVLGRRGERSLLRKELRQGESLTEEGKVVWDKQRPGSKRDRSPANGMSPSGRSPLSKSLKETPVENQELLTQLENNLNAALGVQAAPAIGREALTKSLNKSPAAPAAASQAQQLC